MRNGLIVLAVASIAVAGCKTTETAAVEDERHVEVHVMKHVMETDGEDGEHMIKIHIERDGEDAIHIEGDPNSSEVKEALAKLKADGLVLHEEHMMKMDHEDGEDNVFIMKMDGGESDHKVHKWVMKTEGDEDGEVTIDIDEFITVDGDHIIIKRGDTVEDIKISEGGSHRYEIIIKSDGDHKMVKEHSAKKIIIITGESEEEIRKKLDEMDLDIELEFLTEGEEDLELEK